MERRVKFLKLRFVSDEIRKPLVGADGLSIQIDCQPGVDIAIHLHATKDVLFANLEVLEHFDIGLVTDKRAIGLALLALAALFRLQSPFLEKGLAVFAVAERPYLEKLGKRIHGLGSHAIHAGGELIVLIVVFAASVHLRDAVHHLLKRNAAAIVADTHLTGIIIDININFLTETLDKFINSVIHNLFHEDVNTIVVHGARARFAYIHARTHADMRHRVEGLDTFCSVIVFRHFPITQNFLLIIPKYTAGWNLALPPYSVSQHR